MPRITSTCLDRLIFTPVANNKNWVVAIPFSAARMGGLVISSLGDSCNNKLVAAITENFCRAYALLFEEQKRHCIALEAKQTLYPLT